MPAIEVNCSIRGFRMMTPTVFELTFDTSPPFEFKAGQFISIVIPGAGPNGRDLRRAYSIASTPGVLPVELCIKYVPDGPGTTYLYNLRPGDSFKGFAPYGDFVYKTKPERRVCFIATGTGVAPFRAIGESASYLAAPPTAVECVFGVRDETEVIYAEAMKAIPGMKWIPCVSRPSPAWKGYSGRVTDYLRSVGSDYPWLDTDYYLCGNGDMITEVKALLAEKGVLKEAVHQEKYY
jgi:CDP-4-dehydro-6-deoxyglucose reductase, E3